MPTPFPNNVSQSTNDCHRLRREINLPHPPGRSFTARNMQPRNLQLRRIQCRVQLEQVTQIGRPVLLFCGAASSVPSLYPVQVSYKMSVSRKVAPPRPKSSTEEGQCKVSRKALNFTNKLTEQGHLATSSGETMMRGQPCRPLVQSEVGLGSQARSRTEGPAPALIDKAPQDQTRGSGARYRRYSQLFEQQQ